MSLFIERGRFRLYIGRDGARALPASIFFAWLVKDWRDKARTGYLLPVVWSVSLSWEWLPKLIRVYGSRSYGRMNCYPARLWTGRDHEVVGCCWWVCGEVRLPGIRRSFSLGRLWGPDWI